MARRGRLHGQSGPGALLVGILGLLILAGCTRQYIVERGPQAYYQTAFPIHDTSRDLTRVLEAVKRINVTAVYQTYFFPEEDAPSEAEALTPAVLAQALDTITSQTTRAATAVRLSMRGRNGLLLTAQHAIHLPDTLVQYFDRGGAADGARRAPGARARRIRTVSILVHRANWLLDAPSLVPFRVLVEDPSSDLAFIGYSYPRDRDPEEAPMLPVRAGRSERLSWGSFVYAIGYPSGYPMVTRGIVSASEDYPSDAFVIDGLWNEGMSGGLVLGVRGDTGALEWVGMARASAATTEYRLAAPEGVEETHEPWRPYDGPIFIEEIRRIQYGITLAVPMSRIRTFLREHQETLRAQGYQAPTL
jgi:hypothetical protein